MTRVYQDDTYIDEELLQKTVGEILITIKEKLPKEYQCRYIIGDILSEALSKLDSIQLNL